MVVAHPRHKGLGDDVGGLVENNVCPNGVEVRKDKRVVQIDTNFIRPRLFVCVGL